MVAAWRQSDVGACFDLSDKKGPDKFRIGCTKEQLMLLIGLNGDSCVPFYLGQRISVELNRGCDFLQTLKGGDGFLGGL